MEKKKEKTFRIRSTNLPKPTVRRATTNCGRWQFATNFIISLLFIAHHVIDKKLVLSQLRGCPSRWYGFTKPRLHKLQIPQTPALRLLNFSNSKHPKIYCVPPSHKVYWSQRFSFAAKRERKRSDERKPLVAGDVNLTDHAKIGVNYTSRDRLTSNQ